MKIQSYDNLGYVWDELNQVLILDWTNITGTHCIQYLYGWLNGGILESVTKSKIPHNDNSNIDTDDLFLTQHPGIIEWRSTIPTDTMACLKLIPSFRLEVLQNAILDKQVNELLVSNPLLVWLLHLQLFHGKIGKNNFCQLLKLNQRKILHTLGFPSSNATIRVLKKFKSANLREIGVIRLISLCSNERTLKYLSHTKTPSSWIVSALSECPDLAGKKSWGLLLCLEDDDVRILYEETMRHTNTANILECRNLADLTNLNKRLVEDAQENSTLEELLINDNGEIVKFPAPPLEDSGLIKAIRNQKELYLEGRKMRNCIYNYLLEIIQGKYYVYTMEFPAKLTIGVRIDTEGKIEIDSIKGKCNSTPKFEHLAFVSNWFSSAKKNNLINGLTQYHHISISASPTPFVQQEPASG